MTKPKRSDLQARNAALKAQVTVLTAERNAWEERARDLAAKREADLHPSLRAVLARDARRLWNTAADAAVARLPRWW